MDEFKNPWAKPLWQRNAEDNMSLRHEIEKNYDAFENPWKQEAFEHKGTKQLSASMPQSETSLFGTYTQNSKPQAFAREVKEDKAPDFSDFRNSPLHMGLTAMPGQAHLKHLNTDLVTGREILNTPYSNDILENDCYQSERFKPFAHQIRQNEGENQGVIYADKNTHHIDQPTTYGISQGTLDNYRGKFSDLARSYPKDVKDLTEEQANNLICQYYKESRAEGINDPNLAFAHADSFFNGHGHSVSGWQKALNDVCDANIKVDGATGSELVNSFNQVKDEDKQKLYDEFLKHRLKTVKPQYVKGITNRIKTYR